MPDAPASRHSSGPSGVFALDCLVCGSEGPCEHDVDCQIDGCSLYAGHEGPHAHASSQEITDA